jgi:citrate synthase
MEEITSHEDFNKLRDQLLKWKKRFPMFGHDVRKISDSLEVHMKNYMEHLIRYKQTKSQHCIDKAQDEIDHINRILQTVGKIELMAILSKG